MADITAQMVKDLREKTGAGMGDCKKALVETDGDMTLAIEYLRKKGAASAAKRADKRASEGKIYVSTTDDCKAGVIIEVNCETDFVAMNENFVNYVNTIGKTVINGDYTNYEELAKAKVNDSTIEEHTNDILAMFSEKIEVRRFNKIATTGSVVSYLHAANGKLGVLIEVSTPNLNEKALNMCKDITMQIAAMNPSFITRDDVDQVTLNKEIEIYKTMAIESGKKEDIAERIALGKLEKYYTDACLVEQAFVKDNKKTIGDVLKDISKEVGEEVKINKFYRFSIGEEI
jgi:elongation factor Ts